MLNFATLLSLLLFLAVAALWVRTLRRTDSVAFPDRRHAFFTTPHAVWSATAGTPYWEGPGHSSDQPSANFYRQFGPFFGYTVRPTPGGASHAFLGFVHMAYDQPPPHACRFTYVAVPLWLPLLLSAALPALWLRRRVRRHPPGLCAVCGYDLRATPEKCPECGWNAVRKRDALDVADSPRT